MAIIQTGLDKNKNPVYTDTTTGKPSTKAAFDSYQASLKSGKPAGTAEAEAAAKKELEEVYFSGWTQAKEDAIKNKYPGISFDTVKAAAKQTYDTYTEQSGTHGKSDEQIRADKAKEGAVVVPTRYQVDPKTGEVVAYGSDGKEIGRRNGDVAQDGSVVWTENGKTMTAKPGENDTMTITDSDGKVIADQSTTTTQGKPGQAGEVDTTTVAYTPQSSDTISTTTDNANGGDIAVTGSGDLPPVEVFDPATGGTKTVTDANGDGTIDGADSAGTGNGNGGAGNTDNDTTTTTPAESKTDKTKLNFEMLSRASLFAKGDTYLNQFKGEDGKIDENSEAWKAALDGEELAIISGLGIKREKGEDGSWWYLPDSFAGDEIADAKKYLTKDMQLTVDVLTQQITDMTNSLQADDAGQINSYLDAVKNGDDAGAKTLLEGLLVDGALGTSGKELLLSLANYSLEYDSTLETMNNQWDDAIQEGEDAAFDAKKQFKAAETRLNTQTTWMADSRKYATAQKLGADMATIGASGIIGGSPLLAAAQTKFLQDVQMMQGGVVDKDGNGIDNEMVQYTGKNAAAFKESLVQMGMNPEDYFTTDENGKEQFNSDWFQNKTGLDTEQAKMKRDFEQYYGEGAYDDPTKIGTDGRGLRDFQQALDTATGKYDLGLAGFQNNLEKMQDSYNNEWAYLNPNGGLNIRGYVNNYNKNLDAINSNRPTWGDFAGSLGNLIGNFTNPIQGFINLGGYLERWLK